MTREVFVLKSYGDTTIFACDTPEQVERILEIILPSVVQEVETGVHELLQDLYTNKSNTTPRDILNYLAEEEGNKWDCFERGSGFTELRG